MAPVVCKLLGHRRSRRDARRGGPGATDRGHGGPASVARMAVDTSLVGRSLPPTEPYAVSREKVAEFARATGSQFDGRTAPATFPIVVAFAAMTGLMEDPAVGIALHRLDRPLRALGIEREARALGYSVASASSDELTENRTPRLLDALNGKLAGVAITPLGTGPQGTTKIRIRGQSSIGNNNSPLIVVNGIPIDNTTFGVSGDFGERGGNRNSDTGDGLSSINPDDIVEMSVPLMLSSACDVAW